MFNFFCLEAFTVINTNNISRIEQILGTTSSLTLWDGIEHHSIKLTEMDARWVGENLSEWLEIPLSQRRVTYLEPKRKSQEV